MVSPTFADGTGANCSRWNAIRLRVVMRGALPRGQGHDRATGVDRDRERSPLRGREHRCAVGLRLPVSTAS